LSAQNWEGKIPYKWTQDYLLRKTRRGGQSGEEVGVKVWQGVNKWRCETTFSITDLGGCWGSGMYHVLPCDWTKVPSKTTSLRVSRGGGKSENTTTNLLSHVAEFGGFVQSPPRRLGRPLLNSKL